MQLRHSLSAQGDVSDGSRGSGSTRALLILWAADILICPCIRVVHEDVHHAQKSLT